MAAPIMADQTMCVPIAVQDLANTMPVKLSILLKEYVRIYPADSNTANPAPIAAPINKPFKNFIRSHFIDEINNNKCFSSFFYQSY